MSKMNIRGVNLHVKVIGHGYPLVLMHGGPSADMYTMMGFKPLADSFTLVFYDHRCNGRSTGVDVSTMTFENLTADADALRQALGFEKWAVLGHSFGGNVALEYTLRYPERVSHLVLVTSGGDNDWAQVNSPKVLEQRGFSPEVVETARRFFNGQLEPNEVFPSLMKLSNAYIYHTEKKHMLEALFYGAQTKLRPEALIWAETHELKGWTVMDRLGEIRAPTLVTAGRFDFIYPPEHQEQLAAGIPNARLALIDDAAHSPQDEQQAVTLPIIREFLADVSHV